MLKKKDQKVCSTTIYTQLYNQRPKSGYVTIYSDMVIWAPCINAYGDLIYGITKYIVSVAYADKINILLHMHLAFDLALSHMSYW